MAFFGAYTMWALDLYRIGFPTQIYVYNYVVNSGETHSLDSKGWTESRETKIKPKTNSYTAHNDNSQQLQLSSLSTPRH